MTEGLDAAGQASNSGQGRQLSVRLAVPEMDCPSCAQKVDKSLQRVNGITETTLQPTTGTATVTYDPDRTAEADVVAAIEGAGYEVAGNEGDSNGKSDSEMDIVPPSEIWTSPRAIKTWIGAGFVVLGLLFEFVLAGQNPEVAFLLGYSLTLADGLFLVAIAVSGYPVVRGGYY
ncbi:cation transporter, partial [Halococcus thailandensis]